jgi:hypothetical protein
MNTPVGPSGLAWLSAAGALNKDQARQDMGADWQTEFAKLRSELGTMTGVSLAATGLSLASVPVAMADGSILHIKLDQLKAALNAE